MNKNVWIAVAIVVVLAAVGWYVAQKLPGAQNGGEQINVQGGGAPASNGAESDAMKPPALPN